MPIQTPRARSKGGCASSCVGPSPVTAYSVQVKLHTRYNCQDYANAKTRCKALQGQPLTWIKYTHSCIHLDSINDRFIQVRNGSPRASTRPPVCSLAFTATAECFVCFQCQVLSRGRGDSPAHRACLPPPNAHVNTAIHVVVISCSSSLELSSFSFSSRAARIAHGMLFSRARRARLGSDASSTTTLLVHELAICAPYL